MKYKKRRLKYRKERALLSEVLPFEIPITFSNRHFQQFATEIRLTLERDNVVSWVDGGKAIEQAVKLLLGLNINLAVVHRAALEFGKLVDRCEVKIKAKDFVSIPFRYRIRHKNGAFRELAIPAPFNQLQVVAFYDEYKELIIHYCQQSSFSLRRPSRVARYVYHRDKLHYDLQSDEMISIEEIGKEYETLRSFFVYRNYSNIYKFYESHKFHRAEQKFHDLVVLDISRCFDSIYTHSLLWAQIGKEVAKATLQKHNSKRNSFGDRFDALMQGLNYKETNGIIIGPEFSRIFAELILQRVDVKTSAALANRKLSAGRDYEIFRYVDDYFIFCDGLNKAEEIVDVLQAELRIFNLYLNKGKEKRLVRPIITEISAAKDQIASLLSETIAYSLNDVENIATGILETKGEIFIEGAALKTKFKRILETSGATYKDVMNFTLSVVERRLIRIAKDYKKISPQCQRVRQHALAVIQVLDFCFFIFAADPRVNSTIKISRIVRFCAAFFKDRKRGRNMRDLVYKEIHDHIVFLLRRNRLDVNTQVETLYLLLALDELGEAYKLSASDLEFYFRGEVGSEHRLDELNHLGLTVLLSYIRLRPEYADLRSRVELALIEKMENMRRSDTTKSEYILLLLDLVACPYVSIELKKILLRGEQIVDPAEQDALIELRDNWFTTWKGFDFGKELSAKIGQNVY